MNCPKCGAENPDSAEFCTLCMERLRQADSSSQQRRSGPLPRDSYLAPGEWRGDAETLRPAVSKVVVEKVKRYRIRLAIYGALIALVIIWLVLSFTLWGNPSPGEVSGELIDAANARAPEAFVQLFREQDRAGAEDIYDDVVFYLGGNGKFTDVELTVEQPDNYDARSYLDGGNVSNAAGSTTSISRSNGLVIHMENHGGKWYVVPRGTDLVP